MRRRSIEPKPERPELAARGSNSQRRGSSVARSSQLAGTLVVPLWRSAHFWPRLCFDGLHWSGFVHDWVILPDLPNLFVRGKAKNSIFGRGSLPFPSVALRIDFSTVPRQGSGFVCEVFRVPDL